MEPGGNMRVHMSGRAELDWAPTDRTPAVSQADK
jgi:hypothetical protein